MTEHVTQMNIHFILCHFGGGDIDNLAPALPTFLKYFPDAHVTLYTDDKSLPYPDSVHEIIEVTPPFPRSHRRYGMRSANLYRAVGLLASKAEVAIYSDLDMYFYSEEVKYLPVLAKTFGICIPASPRFLVKVDVLIGTDSDHIMDETGGYGFACCTSPMAFHTASETGRKYLECYTKLLVEEPVRGTLAVYRAAVRSGITPYLLPFQWCVCYQHINIGDEVVLHMGRNSDVEDFYLKKRPFWLIRLRQGLRDLREALTLRRRAVKNTIKDWLRWKK